MFPEHDGMHGGGEEGDSAATRSAGGDVMVRCVVGGGVDAGTQRRSAGRGGAPCGGRTVCELERAVF